jgi:hypothetical protein
MTHPELGLDLVAKLAVLIAEPIDAGVTPAGRRRVIPITGGRVDGPRITGEVLGIVTTPRIEASEGPYAWLNDAVLVGTLVPLLDGNRPTGVSLEFHQIRAK